MFDIDWGGIAKKFITSTATQIPQIYGAYQAGRRANAAADRQSALINAGNTDRMRRLDALTAEGRDVSAPAIAHYRAELARSPGELRPAQEIALGDAQREFSRAPTLARMGGRAFTRGFSDVTNRFRSGAVEANRLTQDRAAAALMGRGNIGLTAGVAGAQAPAQTGLALADVEGGRGQAQADTMATISSYFANAVKDSERESRYKDLKPGGA